METNFTVFDQAAILYILNYWLHRIDWKWVYSVEKLLEFNLYIFFSTCSSSSLSQEKTTHAILVQVRVIVRACLRKESHVVLRLKEGYTCSLFCRGWVHCGISMLSCSFVGICWLNGIHIYRLSECWSWKSFEIHSRSSSRPEALVAANKRRFLPSSKLQTHKTSNKHITKYTDKHRPHSLCHEYSIIRFLFSSVTSPPPPSGSDGRGLTGLWVLAPLVGVLLLR